MASMPQPLVTVVVADETALRRIIREELAALTSARPPLTTPPQPVAPAAAWQPIDHVEIKQGTITRHISLGSPVSVKGLGKRLGPDTNERGIGHGYTVQNIEVRSLFDRSNDLDNVNVTVQKGHEPARIVKLNRIVWKRGPNGLPRTENGA